MAIIPPPPHTTRQSNIEFLRLVCMLFITLNHFTCLGISLGAHAGSDSYMKVWWLINGFVYIGVNCFILISGYFGINFRWRKLLDLYLTCVFYFFGIGIISLAIKGFTLGEVKFLLLKSFLPFSHAGAWFLNCYFVLMLLSPVLNTAMNTLDKNGYQLCLLLLTIINLYIGYFWKLEYSGNIDGFTAMQFVWLYFIAGYIRRYASMGNIQRKKWLWLGIYAGCALLYGLLSITDMSHRIWHWDGWKYNNPVLVAGSIAFFVFFLTLHLNSRIINFASASVFAMYLVQGEMNANFHLYDSIGQWCLIHGDGRILIEYLLAFPLALFFIFAIIPVDQIRKLFSASVLKIYDKLFALQYA